MSETRAKFEAGVITRVCGGRLACGSADAGAANVCTDSRALARGEAFLALIGPNHDAHNYIPQALEAGASVVIAQRQEASWRLPPGAAVVLVEDTTRALLDLAAWHRGRLRGLALAITGSCGKSTVKAMTAAILSRTGRCAAAPKSFNNRIGLSLTLLKADVEDQFVVLELGTNHPGEIDELAALARPHAGLITCIGECHLEGLGTRAGVLEAKAELIPHLHPAGMLALNADDPFCASLASRRRGEVRTFGLSPKAQARAVRVRRDGGGQVFRFAGRDFRIPVPGEHNVRNAAAAICLSRWAGATLEDARQALAEVSLPGLRFEKRRMSEVDFTLDCYNSNPTAMQAALHAFLQEPAPRRRMVICGDMLELGEAADDAHRRLGRMMALASVDTLVAVGALSRLVVEGWQELADPDQKALHVPSADGAWPVVWENLAPGDTVLVKGSRAMHLEVIPEAIEQHVKPMGKEAAA